MTKPKRIDLSRQELDSLKRLLKMIFGSSLDKVWKRASLQPTGTTPDQSWSSPSIINAMGYRRIRCRQNTSGIYGMSIAGSSGGRHL